MSGLRRLLWLCGLFMWVGLLVACGKHAVMAPRDSTTLCYKTATELTQAIREKRVTSLELLNAHIDRIQCHNGPINAVVAMDIEAARARAEAAGKALARREIWGPLHGLPIGIQIIGARNEGRTTIDFARGLSYTLGGFRIPL